MAINRSCILVASALTLIGLLLPLGAASAAAASSPPARIRLTPSNARGQQVNGPGYFRIDARPGSTVRLYASLANLGGRPGTARLVPVDARSAVYGGISYNLPTDPRRRVSKWIHLATSRVHLAPGQARVIPFTVHVPATAHPGKHIGGLTAFVPTAVGASQGFGALRLQLRVVAAVVVTVPGRMHRRLAVTRVAAENQPTGLYVVTHIRNTGRLLARAHFLLRVTRVGATRPILSRRLFLDTMVPGTKVAYPVPWPAKVRYGRYRASVQLSYHGGTAAWKGKVRVSPPAPPPRRPNVPQSGPISQLGVGHGSTAPLAIGICGALLLSFAAFLLGRRRRPASRTPTE